MIFGAWRQWNQKDLEFGNNVTEGQNQKDQGGSMWAARTPVMSLRTTLSSIFGILVHYSHSVLDKKKENCWVHKHCSNHSMTTSMMSTFRLLAKHPLLVKMYFWELDRPEWSVAFISEIFLPAYMIYFS